MLHRPRSSSFSSSLTTTTTRKPFSSLTHTPCTERSNGLLMIPSWTLTTGKARPEHGGEKDGVTYTSISTVACHDQYRLGTHAVLVSRPQLQSSLRALKRRRTRRARWAGAASALAPPDASYDARLLHDARQDVPQTRLPCQTLRSQAAAQRRGPSRAVRTTARRRAWREPVLRTGAVLP